MIKKAFRFVVTADDSDIMTASDLGIRSNTKEEKRKQILEDFLNDLKNGALEMYYEEGYIEDDNFQTFTKINK